MALSCLGAAIKGRAVLFGNTEELAVDSAWQIGESSPKRTKEGFGALSALELLVLRGRSKR